MTTFAPAIELAVSSLFSKGAWTFPAKDGRILIWFGANGARESDEKDHSLMRVAQTLKATFIALRKAKKLGKISFQVFRGHDKQALLDAFDAADEQSVIQVHYVGHGNGGGLFCGYHDPDKAAERAALKTRLLAMKDSADVLRDAAVAGDPSLMTGFFDLADPKKRALRALHPKAFFHIWGCFSGAETHSFDNDAYWKLFLGSASSVPGVAKHIATALGRRVVAARDKQSIHGTNYWYRNSSGVGQSDEKKKKYRPDGIPQWLWPAKGAEWITYDSKGKAAGTEAGGKPPSALTHLVKGVTKTGRSQGFDRAGDALAQLDAAIVDAESRGDRELLARLLASELAVRRADGTIVDRSAFLDAVRPSEARTTRVESTTRIGPDVAIVTSLVTLKSSGRAYENVRLLVREAEVWKVLGWANRER